MTTPTVLSSINSTAAWHNTYDYRFKTSTSTHAIYDLWNISASNWFTSIETSFPQDGFQIKVGIDSTGSDYNVWTDKGSVHPYVVTETSTGTVKLLENDGSLDFEFTKPTTASWISSGGTSGGGAGTLSVVSTGWTYEVPAGVTPVEVPGRELFLNIAASAPTDTYKIYHDGLYHSNVIHTTGTVSSVQDSNDACEYVLYRGTVHTSSSLNTIVATWSRPCNKVFCNFW